MAFWLFIFKNFRSNNLKFDVSSLQLVPFAAAIRELVQRIFCFVHCTNRTRSQKQLSAVEKRIKTTKHLLETLRNIICISKTNIATYQINNDSLYLSSNIFSPRSNIVLYDTA